MWEKKLSPCETAKEKPSSSYTKETGKFREGRDEFLNDMSRAHNARCRLC